MFKNVPSGAVGVNMTHAQKHVAEGSNGELEAVNMALLDKTASAQQKITKHAIHKSVPFGPLGVATAHAQHLVDLVSSLETENVNLESPIKTVLVLQTTHVSVTLITVPHGPPGVTTINVQGHVVQEYNLEIGSAHLVLRAKIALAKQKITEHAMHKPVLTGQLGVSTAHAQRHVDLASKPETENVQMALQEKTVPAPGQTPARVILNYVQAGLSGVSLTNVLSHVELDFSPGVVPVAMEAPGPIALAEHTI